MLSSQTLLIKDILIDAIKIGAADLHFSVGNKPVYKINGKWVIMEEREIIDQDFISNLSMSLLDQAQQEKLKQNKEIFFSYDFERDLRFKINVFYQRGFLSATFRHIPMKIPTIDGLGLNPIIKKIADYKKGLILISGPFGSGRSSTAAAIIEEINLKRKQYIITIEQPIEYIFTNKESIIEQREVGIDTNSFEDALKYFQEEDGDILFLEAVPDIKLWPLVLEIANGSALVITTINSDTSSGAISSVVDGFSSLDQARIRDLLSNALKAVICQKTLPRVGGGSIAAQEILMANDAIKSSIKSGNLNQIQNVMQLSKKDGMVTFDFNLAELARNRRINTDDALSNATDKKLLESLLQ
ncbi:MAG: ATPase, T2SS/T4P/T4SS family [Candidatus Buchananbacteria bacterium]